MVNFNVAKCVHTTTSPRGNSNYAIKHRLLSQLFRLSEKTQWTAEPSMFLKSVSDISKYTLDTFDRITSRIHTLPVNETMLKWVNSAFSKDFTSLAFQFRQESKSVPILKEKIAEWKARLDKPSTVRLDFSQLRTAVSRTVDTLVPRGANYYFKLYPLQQYLDEINWNANAGFPTFRKRKELYEWTVQAFESLVSQRLNVPFFSYPTIMFRRTQIRAAKLKIRLVFGAPHLVTVVETLFFLPLKHILFSRTSGYVTGVMQKDIANKISSQKHRHKYCFDFRAFDLTLPHQVTKLAFAILRAILNLRDGDYFGKLFRFCEAWFICAPVYFPVLGLVRRNRGVPSGSVFTNMVDSICALIIMHYVMCVCRLSSEQYELLVHGDDVVVCSDVRLDEKKIRNIVFAAFGMELKDTSNTYFAAGIDECHFLGSHWKEGKPYRDVDDMLLSCILWSGNYPMGMSKQDAYASRFVSVLGYHCEAEELLAKLGVAIPTRYFMYKDAGYSVLHEKIRRAKDHRGLFVSVPKGVRLWELR